MQEDWLYLSPESRMLLKSVRRLVREEIQPRSVELEGAEEFPAEIFQRYAEIGLLGLIVPESLGGGGMDLLTLCLVIEELGAALDNASNMVLAQCLPICVLLETARPEQISRYVPPLVRGELRSSVAFTEPEAGSDWGSMRTRAEAVEGGYIINGRKSFIGFAGEGNFFVVFCRLRPEKGTKGLDALIVERDRPGLSLGRREDLLNSRVVAPREIVLENVFVPAENLVGVEGAGVRGAMRALDYLRITMAARCVGSSQGALNKALAYTSQRIQFGRPLLDNQGVQFILADAAIKLEAARQLTYQAAKVAAEFSPDSSYLTSAAKCFATEVAVKIVEDCIQVMGANGMTTDYGLVYRLLNVKMGQIIEGSNELLKGFVIRKLASDLKK